MAENFCLFDEWFAAVPGLKQLQKSIPHVGDIPRLLQQRNFGTSSPALPQRSVFQQLTENGMSWINYSNRTAPSTPDAAFYNWARGRLA
jgi:phospholipase C